jgi:hypothetical protein
MFGVPLVFAAFANIGREATVLYCNEWPILKGLQRKLFMDKSVSKHVNHKKTSKYYIISRGTVLLRKPDDIHPELCRKTI